MHRLSHVVLFVFAVSLLAACQLSGAKPGAGPEAGVTPNAVTGDAIEVTALDAVADVGATAPGADVGATAPEAAKPVASETAAPPQAAPVGADPAPGAEPAPKPDLTETPVTPKSEMQLACEKKGGSWYQVGKGDAHACVRKTKDAMKRCERESQCESVCLARSGTCAPFKPMYGCNDILQDNGARVTLCLD